MACPSSITPPLYRWHKHNVQHKHVIASLGAARPLAQTLHGFVGTSTSSSTSTSLSKQKLKLPSPVNCK
eukprot:6457652-Amphidinium_carterae.1